MQPRIFVSSVIDGFQEFRDAARSAIKGVGGEPILIEDFGGLPISPRNACLDGVASCDIVIIIVGERGGYVTPSGKLVVEEEYEEAQRKKLPILIFIQSGVKDELAERFVNKVSGYIEGFYRKTFKNSGDLKKVIEETLQPVIKSWGRLKVDLSMIEENLAKSIENGQHVPTIRFVLCPERMDEFIDPVILENTEFKDEILEIGHSSKVKLFTYE